VKPENVAPFPTALVPVIEAIVTEMKCLPPLPTGVPQMIEVADTHASDEHRVVPILVELETEDDAKLRPITEIETCWHVGALWYFRYVTAGASNVNLLRAVPTTLEIDTADETLLPEPSGVAHVSVVWEDHCTVRHVDEPKRTVDDVTSTAKLMPCTVINALPVDGPFTFIPNHVGTGASYVKILS
jgi:hypothetical protein